MFIWIRKYMKNCSRSVIEENEKNWVERNKRFLGDNRENTPRKVAMAYAESLGCENIDHLAELADSELDWDYFEQQPEDDYIIADQD